MKEILYLEVPTPNTNMVRTWLQQDFKPDLGKKSLTSEGFRLQFPETAGELSVFVWSVQRTTYLKVFRWTEQPIPGEQQFLKYLTLNLRARFPYQYPEPPTVNLSQQSIFEALAQEYPLTVRYFQEMPNGEYDLNRVYWWEQQWREGVRHPKQPKQVVFKGSVRVASPQEKFSALSLEESSGLVDPTQHSTLNPENYTELKGQTSSTYDLVYLGGALGVIHAAVMARLGYRVLLLERLPFGRMNREWNISRSEFQSLIDLGLFSPVEFEGIIAREYQDGFNKFFDANNPPQAKAPVLHTPTVLNVALDSGKLLHLCGKKLKEAGGEIWDETEFTWAEIEHHQALVQTTHLPTQTKRQITGRLLVDAMGSASPIAWQLNGGRAFDSVCPTVGAVISSGFEPSVWNSAYGDVLCSHGDISRGRQLIWELFPGEGEELTIYLFHYHQAHPDNPGSLLEMYEDFFAILPEYRRCEMDKLVWKKATFGYIPGHFSIGSRDRRVAFDRLIAIGDAASLQSPLVFTGFGSLIRNLSRLTDLLDTALKHDLLSAADLNQIRAYQSNVAVTWLFSRGMMVPTGRHLPPQRLNSMLNTFFGILATESPALADAFIKDRTGWLPFNRMALKAALSNPALLYWIWDLVGPKDLLRWLGSYLSFTVDGLTNVLFGSWFPGLVRWMQPWLEPNQPRLWLWLLARSYAMSYTMGQPRIERSLPSESKTSPTIVESRSH
jgi:lycopene cyclase CruA